MSEKKEMAATGITCVPNGKPPIKFTVSTAAANSVGSISGMLGKAGSKADLLSWASKINEAARTINSAPNFPAAQPSIDQFNIGVIIYNGALRTLQSNEPRLEPLSTNESEFEKIKTAATEATKIIESSAPTIAAMKGGRRKTHRKKHGKTRGKRSKTHKKHNKHSRKH
jgi:hypothetical protein